MFRVTTRLRFIEPQLASPVDQPPEGKHWIHEIKNDGYRSQVVIERGQARVFSRNGHDWSDRYPGIVRAAARLRCKSAIIDGEAVVQDENGVSNFEALGSAIRARSANILVYAFDLLHIDGKDLRRQTLSERRAVLKNLIEPRRSAAAHSPPRSRPTTTTLVCPRLAGRQRQGARVGLDCVNERRPKPTVRPERSFVVRRATNAPQTAALAADPLASCYRIPA